MRNLAATRKFGRDWSPMQTDQTWLLALVSAGAFIFAMIVVFVVSQFTNIRISAWGVVGSIGPWYMAAISAWIMYVQIPLFITHGRTRTFGFQQWLVTGGVLVPFGAIIMAIGFLLERGIYNLAGFSYDGEMDQYFSGANDLLTIAYHFLLTFGVWFALGGLVGICLYRSDDWGWVSIPFAILIASLSGAWDHTNGGLFNVLRRILPGIDYGSAWLDLVLSVAVATVAIWLIWRISRTLPIRNP